MKTLVTVIIPVYNAEKTIEQSIRSIQIQTYSNLEIIVINDASTDKTEDILKKVIEKDNRVLLFSLKKNLGVGAARNIGLKNSKGSIIVFQDADDLSLDTRIEKQIQPLFDNKILFSISQIYRSRCHFDELDINNQREMIDLVKSRRKPNWRGKYEYRDQVTFGLMTIVYRRDVFENFGLFEEQQFGEDLEFLERIFYSTTQEVFSKKYNGHSFINYKKEGTHLYHKIEEVLLISPKLNKNNLTIQFQKKKKEVQLIHKNFRNKIRLNNLNLFPKLTPLQTRDSLLPTIVYPELFINRKIDSPSLVNQNIKKLFSFFK